MTGILINMALCSNWLFMYFSLDPLTIDYAIDVLCYNIGDVIGALTGGTK